MKIINTGILSLLMILVVTTGAFSDTSFRCGNEIISEGDTMYRVKDRCGEPDSEQHVGEKTVYKSKLKGKQIRYITEWIYERNGRIVILTFEGSRLVKKEDARR